MSDSVRLICLGIFWGNTYILKGYNFLNNQGKALDNAISTQSLIFVRGRVRYISLW